MTNTVSLPTAILIFDIDGVIRDVGGSYRRALADTVEHFTNNEYRPTPEDIDKLKLEGDWNNDWEASQEFIRRHFDSQGKLQKLHLDYEQIVAFFQSRYRGTNPEKWTGYICEEPLLVNSTYFDSLTQSAIPWGFFSGATRASATYILEERLGLITPILTAMEDAPGKPDPTGLFHTTEIILDKFKLKEVDKRTPVIYVGDTVADMYVIKKAREQQQNRQWIAVGVLPPHVQQESSRREAYAENLLKAGAALILNDLEQLSISRIKELRDKRNNG
ncbi:MAG: TIGR01548 family HAD-type hydrolase [Cyanobacteria bacterium P01_A01_bin.45]